MTAERGDDLTALAGRPWFAANEVLAFLLELAAVGCLCRWGFAAGDTTAAGLLLGLGAPAAAVTLWALFAAPRARLRPPLPAVLLVKALVFGAAAWSLHDLGHPLAGLLFAATAVLNTALAERFRFPPESRAD
jgi:hypothetical protein